ncbi:MAG: TetR/AcrR family transcriptional regulator [Novosphingobium sp.]|nr:TetR/AcrR family transcriptional regulator [Novosphingobium sp.]
MKRDTAEEMVRAATAGLLKKGFSGCGINEILSAVKVPKGSFYHHFPSKEALVERALQVYAEDVREKLALDLEEPAKHPFEAIQLALTNGRNGLVTAEFFGGCLLGTLAQELGSQDSPMLGKLRAHFRSWEALFEQALDRAKVTGDLSAKIDSRGLAGFILNGWEGAVLRAKLEKSAAPLDDFLSHIQRYLHALR